MRRFLAKPNPSDAARLMNAVLQNKGSSDSQDVCNIVVLYDGDGTRARALAACNYLVKQFWPEVELKFHWWRTDFLQDAQLAAVAAGDAVQADFLIISSESDREFSPVLESWFESWLERRTDREGALVDLLPISQSGREATARGRFLQEVTRRGKFDYLTTIPSGAEESRRTMTGIIDDILGEPRPSSHYGLNE